MSTTTIPRSVLSVSGNSNQRANKMLVSNALAMMACTWLTGCGLVPVPAEPQNLPVEIETVKSNPAQFDQPLVTDVDVAQIAPAPTNINELTGCWGSYAFEELDTARLIEEAAQENPDEFLTLAPSIVLFASLVPSNITYDVFVALRFDGQRLQTQVYSNLNIPGMNTIPSYVATEGDYALLESGELQLRIDTRYTSDPDTGQIDALEYVGVELDPETGDPQTIAVQHQLHTIALDSDELYMSSSEPDTRGELAIDVGHFTRFDCEL